jgi:hypothetical protein
MVEDLEIREAESGERAEAVLAVRLFIPGVGEEARYDLPLVRARPEPPVMVVEETVGPDGRRWVVTRERGSFSGHGQGSLGSGWPPGSPSWQYDSTVSVTGRSAVEVEVRASADWEHPDGASGGYEVELVVPWLGAARADTPTEGWVAAEITPAEPSAAPPPASG